MTDNPDRRPQRPAKDMSAHGASFGNHLVVQAVFDTLKDHMPKVYESLKSTVLELVEWSDDRHGAALQGLVEGKPDIAKLTFTAGVKRVVSAYELEDDVDPDEGDPLLKYARGVLLMQEALDEIPLEDSDALNRLRDALGQPRNPEETAHLRRELEDRERNR